MANIFVEDFTYLSSIDDLKDSSSIDMANESDDNLKILIRKAELIIDDIIVEYGTKLVDTQSTIFPTTVDTTVPVAIKKATVLLCEQLYSNGVLTGNIDSVDSIGAESYGNHSISYRNRKKRFGLYDKYITDEVYLLLKKYLVNSNKNTWLI